MIYLCSPYSHPRAEIRERRFRAACHATARLIAAGQLVFSPIVIGHPLVHLGLPTDWPFWEAHARWHLERCDEVVVLMLDGWQQSVGVQAELRFTAALGKPISYRAAPLSHEELAPCL